MYVFIDCLCDPLGTTTGTNCDGVTGECTCKTGYTDRDCSKCDDLYFKESSGTCASKLMTSKPKVLFRGQNKTSFQFVIAIPWALWVPGVPTVLVNVLVKTDTLVQNVKNALQITTSLPRISALVRFTVEHRTLFNKKYF